MRFCVASRYTVPGRIEKWRGYREAGWDIVSTWIDENHAEVPIADAWANIEAEMEQADALVLWVPMETDLPVRGALVMAGMALGMGLPVGVVAPPEVVAKLGSWLELENVFVFDTVGQAFKSLKKRVEAG